MKFIRKAKIKDYFYKTLEKEGKNLEPPAFYHEIFDFDKSFDDIKIERNLNNLNTKIADVSTSSLSHEEIEKEEDLKYKQDKCNNVMSLGVNQKVNKELKRSKNNRKSVKPNPFYKALQERKRIKREKCAEKEVIRQERQLCKQKRETYSSQRNKTKKKLLKCNSKGQPVMKSRIDHILSKIRE